MRGATATGDVSGHFTLDADDLLHLTDRMAACDDTLRGLASHLETRIAALHMTWAGEAADAHRLAQAEWERGFGGMRDGLAGMRAAATVAHGNYTSAALTNVRMWDQMG